MLASLLWKRQPQELYEGFKDDYGEDANEWYIASHRGYELTAIALVLSLCNNITTFCKGSIALDLHKTSCLK
jgi:hypothetical protein